MSTDETSDATASAEMKRKFQEALAKKTVSSGRARRTSTVIPPSRARTRP